MKLVIVESPTKAKTISKFLDKEYKAESSYGHLRDLPKSQLGIDVEQDFLPRYVVPRRVQSRVTALKKAAAKADGIILATDEDREGEAIAWHISKILNLDETKIERIAFHEITEDAIREALKHPRFIDMNLVDAQQARRILDRLVGYKLSPFLWKKVRRGLSAGRVQSVALRLIVEREEEIKAFIPQEYWTIRALLSRKDSEKGVFETTLVKIGGEPIPQFGIPTEDDSKKIVTDLESGNFRVSRVEKKELKKNPLGPFITSTLQQSAAQRLGFSAKKTMFLAQSLYESGHITYMRTDSLHLSEEALKGAHDWISSNLDKKYLLDAPRHFKTKSRLAQEAHEAVRPTNVATGSRIEGLEKDQERVYELIWRRFVASQLPQALFDATTIEVETESKKRYTLRASGSILRFDGFTKIWPTKFEEKEMPDCKEGEMLTLQEIRPEQHFTEPPPRYNEASLIKTLEQFGIGRPSTYAPIISVIQDRGYVEKQSGRFYPTDIGTLVNKVLTEHFPEVFNIEFTAKMEGDLDEIASGHERWQSVIGEFYSPFAKLLEQKYEEVQKSEVAEEKTDIVCENCGRPMIIKFGRFGRFIACSGYPECKTAKPLREPPKSTGLKCPKCGEGEIIERRVSKKGRSRGRIFWGCNRYPKCDHATWENPVPQKTDDAT
ncbi:type I DNA topoisomerase [Candidatus Parcubacteria bacterium]|nr:MAG: type I DNA topoisomerase [Candidatus Parcubacteria bacterium]